MPVYLDCNATTPLEPAVRERMLEYMEDEFGNAGSRTHEYGLRAKRAVQEAREAVAEVVGAREDEVVFTSGATESNNLATLGLAPHGKKTGRTHIISTSIEHKAVLEPLGALEEEGFEIELVAPNSEGWVDPEAVAARVRDDTLLVSMMQVNNETGVRQPIQELARELDDWDGYIHVDAAQGFGKELTPLQDDRLDLISISAHKVYGPKGCGALVARRRGYDRIPLEPLVHGGGQERGLRSGTVPVPLVVGLGEASRIAKEAAAKRAEQCSSYREEVLESLLPLGPELNGDPDRCLPHVVNLSFPGLDSEAVMVLLKDLVAISNGSACTSQDYKPSHVLTAMGLSQERVQGAIRISWCHLTEGPDWGAVAERISTLL